MTELEDGDDVFLRTDDKIYLQCTRTHENKQGTVSRKHSDQIWLDSFGLGLDMGTEVR